MAGARRMRRLDLVRYNTLAVSNAPFKLTVEGPPPDDKDAICSSANALRVNHGRWVRKDAIAAPHLRSLTPHFWWAHRITLPASVEDHATLFEHTFVPYDCKLLQRSLHDWIELVKPRSILAIGDSVLRDPFCLILHKNLRRGAHIDKQCAWSDTAEYHTRLAIPMAQIRGYHSLRSKIQQQTAQAPQS
ncbi:hypothetical protein OIV83_006510 [Microbotryomycetes sp. JL201]|nr:hypothetical protein OIV83_006510 [Microbotryomycetes sp. JL201]